MRLSSLSRTTNNHVLKASLSFITTQILVVVLGVLFTSLAEGIPIRWITFILLALIVLVLLGYVATTMVKASRIRYVAFVSSAATDVSYYNKLQAAIVQEAADTSKMGKFTYVVFPWIASAAKAHLQIHSLQRLNHSGIIMVPDKDANYLDGIEEHKVPIVLVDATPGPLWKVPQNVKMSGGDEQSGGQQVAKLIASHIYQTFEGALAEANRSTIWIVQGTNFRFMGEQRHKVFESEISSVFPGARIIKSPECNFSREEARRWTYERIKNLYEDKKAKSQHDEAEPFDHFPDVIFCCNDDMALGSREALRQLEEEDSEIFIDKRSRPMIVGYDGIDEMKVLLRSRQEKFLIGTVDVDIVAQAKNAWQELLAMIEKREPKVNIIHPKSIERGWYHGESRD